MALILKFRFVFLFLLVSLATSAWAQEKSKPNLKIITPPGWREDLMKLPPDFAPDMSWTGWEIAEFAPGMFKAGEPDFFSYIFLIQLEEPRPDWEEQLLLYYTGLARAVMKDPKLDVSEFEVSMKGDARSSFGTVEWIEPFATKKPQKLYLECHQLRDGLWYGCVSPKRWDWPIWTEMRRICNELESVQSRDS